MKTDIQQNGINKPLVKNAEFAGIFIISRFQTKL